MATLLVGQSGGPTTVINASLQGVIDAAKKNNIKAYGLHYGIQGILKEDFVKINDDISLIPGAYLGSVRFCLSKDEDYKRILEVFKKYDVRYFLYIGGNDSMDTINKIDLYLKKVNYKCSCIGVPKTIDNDLVLTHNTPGYGSAAKYIASTIEEIYLDTNSYEKGRVTIVEIMGRDAGWLAASSKLASLNNMGPDFIYLPEVSFNIDKFLKDVKAKYENRKKVLIAISEGIRDKEGTYILNYREKGNTTDNFGHLQLGGVALVLCNIITSQLNISTRAIELNLPQRCAMHLASKKDVKDAYKCGYKAVEHAINNESGGMVSLPSFKLVNLTNVATKVKYFPKKWIIDDNQISDSYLKYAKPLIKGEIKIKYKNGLPDYKH